MKLAKQLVPNNKAVEEIAARGTVTSVRCSKPLGLKNS